MAIVSISRIQHRRGVRADLPPSLNEAELGWCLDTRQLFIGNGNTFTGNSEILTQWSPNDQIITHVYVGSSNNIANTAVTGSPTIRTLGSILDDYLNVKDYGAVGDGITDDTAAIQAAIADEWSRIADTPYSNLLSRNTIYFPAGNYLVSSSIKLYPYTTLAGEGINRTQITMIPGGTTPVMVTADSLGQTGASIGTNGGILPTSITVRGMNLDNTNGSLTSPVVLLQRCTGVTISSCKLIGSWTLGSGAGTGNHGVLIQSLGTAVATSDIYLAGVSIRNADKAVYMADPINRVYIESSNIYSSWLGVYAGNSLDGQTNDVWVRGTSFRDIDDSGIYVDSDGFFSSSNNSFASIAGIPIAWAFGSYHCQSMGDSFDTDDRTLRISNGSPGYNLIFDQYQTELISNEPTARQETLLANQAGAYTNIAFDIGQYSTSFTAFIDYTLSLDTYRRSGRLTIVSDTVTATISDATTELNLDASVTFGVAITAGFLIEVTYTSTGSGPSGNMSYIQTLWGV